MQVAKCEIELEHNECGSDVKRVHRGDDIWVSNGRLLWAACLYDRMCSSGLILQPSKQLFGRHGEFLLSRNYVLHVQSVGGPKLGFVAKYGCE